METTQTSRCLLAIQRLMLRFVSKQVQAQLLQFAAKNIGLNPALLTSPINPQHMTMLNQLYQLQLVSGQTHARPAAERSAGGDAGAAHGWPRGPGVGHASSPGSDPETSRGFQTVERTRAFPAQGVFRALSALWLRRVAQTCRETRLRSGPRPAFPVQPLVSATERENHFSAVF